jgi:hypothetical protein
VASDGKVGNPGLGDDLLQQVRAHGRSAATSSKRPRSSACRPTRRKTRARAEGWKTSEDRSHPLPASRTATRADYWAVSVDGELWRPPFTERGRWPSRRLSRASMTLALSGPVTGRATPHRPQLTPSEG